MSQNIEEYLEKKSQTLQGSIAIGTFERVKTLIITIHQRIVISGADLPYPDILPLEDGSFDIKWVIRQWKLTCNVPADKSQLLGIFERKDHDITSQLITTTDFDDARDLITSRISLNIHQ